ncbi:S-layer homology domain-containing protein [Halalkalibacter kiskunsagensis]|uniref:S-layer homology domain-containing protein n=1 Tax=Halalkalibacter kiskunsagensis TaxID=1548599 RepID=A0ABV6K9L0_9BACI
MKRVCCLISSFILILSSCGFQGAKDEVESQQEQAPQQQLTTQAVEFSDVSPNHWAREEILYLNQQNIINGFSDGSFKPGISVTRTQAARMLVGALGLELEGRPAPDFEDISENFHAYDVVAAVADEGIITGRDGHFMPGDPLTRGQMAAILKRAFQLEGTWDRDFRDILSNHPFYDEIQALAANNITTGFSSDNTFRASQPTTRAHFSVFLARTIDESFKPAEPEHDGELTIHHLNVGQGDSTLVTTPSGKTMLVDAGTRTAGQAVVDYLKKAGIDTIDRLVITHPHADHIGGAVEVMEEFEIGQVVDSGALHDSQTYMQYLSYIDQNDVPFHEAETGEHIEIDPALTIRVINSGQAGDSLNNASVSLHLRYGDFAYVITGDGEVEAERRIVENFTVVADVLRVGHHGSRTSSNDFFLNGVKAKEAIISYGVGNSYGHPHTEALHRLVNSGVSGIHETIGEPIIVTSDGSNFSVSEGHQSIIPPVEPAPDPTEPEQVEPAPDQGPGYPVNINTADKETLQLITGVGPVIADRIIDYRNSNGSFTSIEQLKSIQGIGDVTFENMRQEITI